MRILAALFDHRGVELSVSELAHTTGVAIATASREVERLQAHGLVTSRSVGRSRFVSANWALAWSDALATILAHTAGLPGRIAVVLRGVSGVDAALIYGSWAARRAGEVGPPPHDIYLLVVGEADLGELRKAVRPLERDLSIEINPVVVSSDEWARSGDAFLEELRSRPMFQLDLSAGTGA